MAEREHDGATPLEASMIGLLCGTLVAIMESEELKSRLGQDQP